MTKGNSFSDFEIADDLRQPGLKIPRVSLYANAKFSTYCFHQITASLKPEFHTILSKNEMRRYLDTDHQGRGMGQNELMTIT